MKKKSKSRIVIYDIITWYEAVKLVETKQITILNK